VHCKTKLYKDFIKEYLEVNLVPARRLALFAAIFYLLFSGLDAYLSGSITSDLVKTRLVFTSLLFFITVLSLLKIFQLHWQKIFALFVIVGGIGVIVFTTYIHCPLKSLYAQGLLLVIFYGYTMNRLLLVPATIVGLTITTIYMISVVNCTEISQQTMITSFFFQVAVNLFGIINIYQRQRLLFNEFKHRVKEKDNSKQINKLNKKLLHLNKKLNDQASKDGLTGIANRRYFDEYLDKLILNCHNESSTMSLIMLDIDFFKQYNDYYGHLKGDQCLVQIAKLMVENLEGSNGMAARYGGEEFCMLLPNTGSKQATVIVENFKNGLQKLRIQHQDSKISPFITASYGLISVENNFHSISAKKVINFADSCLYKSKNEGRNKITTSII